MKRILKVETVRRLHIIIIQSLNKEMKPGLTGMTCWHFQYKGIKRQTRYGQMSPPPPNTQIQKR